MADTEHQHEDPGAAALMARQQRETAPEALLAWDAAEYIHYERSRTWFLVAGGLAVLMIGYSIITEAYITAVVVTLLAGVVYLYTHELPGTQRVTVSRLGVAVGPRFYPFASVKAFWLVLNDDVRQLRFETSGSLGQLVVVELGDVDPVLVRKVLSQEIVEATGRDEGMIDKLARALKL